MTRDEILRTFPLFRNRMYQDLGPGVVTAITPHPESGRHFTVQVKLASDDVVSTITPAIRRKDKNGVVHVDSRMKEGQTIGHFHRRRAIVLFQRNDHLASQPQLHEEKLA